MAHWPSTLANAYHLFVVAGYPTLGKSSALWMAARTRFPLFGNDHGSVVPTVDNLEHIRENSPTVEKLKAGFWLTLTDIPHLNMQSRLPARLILHLDLLLTFLRLRPASKEISQPSQVDSIFERLFAQSSLRKYRKCTVITLYAPLPEIQRRWQHRFPTGIPPTSSPILVAKDRLINDRHVAEPALAAIYRGWERQLKSLSLSGVLDRHMRITSRLNGEPPSSGSAMPVLEQPPVD